MKKILSVLLATFLFLSVGVGAFSASAATSSDTVLVLDYSGSMDGAPLKTLKQTVTLFCEGVVETAGTNRVAIVAYGEDVKFLNFTQDYDAMAAFVNNPGVSDWSTNIAGGLAKARDLINASTAEVKNVLLMTDGMPNDGAYVESGKYAYADHSCYAYANAAYNVAVELWDNCYLYTLGFFHSLTGQSLEFGRRFLEDMAHPSDALDEEENGYWEVIDPADLEVTFEDILNILQDEMSQEWWQTLPDWLQWILRIFFFGWLWM